VNPVTEAASVLLTRGPGSPEVFLVRRANNLRFLGGFHAFPGGKVGPPDRELAEGRPGLSARLVAAVRELFEETGVLIARRPDGSFPSASDETAQLRRELLADSVTFRDLLGRLDLGLNPEDLTPSGSLVTPEFSPVRFDTGFFVAALPPGQQAEVWPGELEAGAWLGAEECLRAWTRGEMLVSPPTVSLLGAVRGRPIEELPARVRPLLDALDAGAIHPIWFSPGVRMIPLFCQGLPPSTHTNAYLVGTDTRYLIDPGPAEAAEQARLFEVLDEKKAAGCLAAVVLTHHHPDHVGAVTACARRYGVPVFAHAVTARLLAGKVLVDRELGDGDRLDLGRAPHGDGSWHLEAVFTPGHDPGHLAFYERSYGLLFAGDMVSTLSSVVIAPAGGGDLTLYLDSLRRLQTYPSRLLLPAHGSPTARTAFTLAESLKHRMDRERELLEALRAGPRRVPDLAMQLYRGLPEKLMRFAEMQVHAGLIKLEREARAAAAGPEWRLVLPT
jgi:glyoxylase-like metal-dependent hydrolase (beta-lactamase superfamily II)/8-oxo-dGTP pyrophosphatase MutT (NUDIX family)